MLTGIELFQHRFSGNPENHSKNPDIANKEATSVLRPFRRHFLKYFYITIVGAKIVLRKGACNSELNFAPKAQNLTFAEGEL